MSELTGRRRALTRRAYLGTLGAASTTLAGCVTPVGRARSQTVPIEYVDVAGVRSRETFQPVVAALESRHDVTVDFQFTEIPYENIRRQLLTRVGGGNAPDIAAIDQIWLGEFVDGGALVALDEVADDVDFDDYLDPFASIVTHHGSVYGFPTTTDVRGMYWNKDAFEAAGLDPDRPPRTWSEFFEVASQLHDPPETYGAAYLVVPGRWTVTLFGAGGRLVDGTEPRFDEEPGVEAARFVDRLYNDASVSSPEPTYENGSRLARDFLSGQYAITVVEGSWLEYFWTNQGHDRASMVERFGFAPSPTLDGKPATMSGGHVWAAFESTDHPEIVRDFLRIAAGREFNHHLSVSTGEIPTRRSLLDDAGIWGSVTYEDAVRDLLAHTRLRPVRHWPAIDQHLSTALQRIAYDRADPEDALTDAADHFRTAVE